MKFYRFKAVFFAALLTLCVLDSCAGTKGKNVENDKKVEAFITTMMNESQYEDYAFLKKHCTPKMLEFLAECYDYDCESGDCLAGWMFRTEAQDNSEECRNGVEEVKSVGNGWYEYTFYDGGFKGITRLKIVFKGDLIMVDELVKVYDQAHEEAMKNFEDVEGGE